MHMLARGDRTAIEKVMTGDIENVRPHAVIWKGQNRVTRVHDSTVRPP